MRKIAAFVTLVSLFFFGYMAPNSYAREPMIKGFDRPYEVNRLVGTFVNNPQGEYLGKIDDFIVDEGRIGFAILSHGGFLGVGGRLIAVPFSALSYDHERRHFVLDMSRERLESAPGFEKGTNLSNRTWAEDVYKFFGQQPYWTEGGYGGEGMSTLDQPIKEEKMEDFPSGYQYYPWP